MKLLRWSLRSKKNFVLAIVLVWSSAAAMVFLLNLLVRGGDGSPEFFGILLLAPAVALFWAIVMWELFFKNQFKETGRQDPK